MTTHLVIPDTQVGPDTPTDHLRWIGKYILDKKPDVIVHLGDHWDMRSLSHYDQGKKRAENQRYKADIDAGNAALTLLDEPTAKSNWAKRQRDKEEYSPRKVLLRGNHENRIVRAVEDDPKLEGAISLDDLNSRDWEVHDFLNVVTIDGVSYSHYFYNPMTGRPYGGSNIETRLKTVGHSFTMGHQQGLRFGLVETIAGAKHGLVAGTCYMHNEDYLGPQGNSQWRGIIMCHEVTHGAYDIMTVSLNYLCQRYEGVPVAKFMRENYPDIDNSWARRGA